MKLDAKKLNTFLFYAICLVLFIIIIVSITAFSVRAKKDNKIAQEQQKIISEKTLGNAALFNEFGRLRSFSSDTQKIPVIITPVLKYAANNTPLYEEICQKKGKLQNCITSYFTDKTKKQFFQIGEENAKKQILQKLNENLSMGKIEEIYFEELIFLE